MCYYVVINVVINVYLVFQEANYRLLMLLDHIPHISFDCLDVPTTTCGVTQVLC